MALRLRRPGASGTETSFNCDVLLPMAPFSVYGFEPRDRDALAKLALSIAKLLIFWAPPRDPKRTLTSMSNEQYIIVNRFTHLPSLGRPCKGLPDHEPCKSDRCPGAGARR